MANPPRGIRAAERGVMFFGGKKGECNGHPAARTVTGLAAITG